MKRFYPEVREGLDLAAQYCRNWKSLIVVQKAFPYTIEMVQAMISIAITEGDGDLAIFILLAYVGLFRLGELFKLRCRMIDIVASNFCVVNLLSSKTSRSPVTVAIRDPVLISVLGPLLSRKRPEQYLYEGSYRCMCKFLRRFAFYMDMPGDRFTGHGFRRGGATHLYRTHRNFEMVQSTGRWSCAKSCRQYLDEAMAERAMFDLSPKGAAFIVKGMDCYAKCMRSLL